VEKTKHILEWRWPNFDPSEFACQHCGQTYYWPEFFDKIQTVRSELDRPLSILSGHRCSLHNAMVGGAPLSQHLKLAADISSKGHDKAKLLRACQSAGFAGFGFYNTFLHIDLGRPREWWSGEKAKKLWQI